MLMAKRSKLEACLICGEAPCVCGKPTVSSKKVVRNKVESEVKADTPVVRSKPRASFLHLMKQEAASAPEQPLPKIESRGTAKKSKRRSIEISDTRSEDEIIFSAAIKAFSSLMHPDEKEKYKMILESGPITLDEKRAMWKAGRRKE